MSYDTPGLDRRAVLPEHLHPVTRGEKAAIERASAKRPAVLARFDFEEKQGALAWSTAGGDVFGRLTGQARRVPGKVGQGLELTGRGEFAPAPFPIDEELRLPETEYAVSFWFRTKTAKVPLCEARRYSSYNNRWSHHVVWLEGGKLQFQLQGDAPLSTETTVNDDT
jgi:hypothetical protein